MGSHDVNYPIHTTQLTNGLRVVISPDHSVPVVAVNIWYDVGSRDELRGQHGWAHLFEHLMFSGSAHVASGEHLQLLQNLGAAVNATTWFDRTNYFETLPSGALDLALWLEADRLGTLPETLTDHSLEVQREVVTEEKRQRYDNVPYGDAMAKIVALTFPSDHPYGHTTIGDPRDLASATTQAAADFFRRHYRPDNAVLTLVGDVSPRDGFRKAEQAFGHLPGGNPEERVPTDPLSPLSGVPTEVIRRAVPADASYLAWRLPVRDTPEYDACDLAMAILGQGQSSRLHRDTVRDRRLASAASAQALPLAAGTSLGLVHLRALPHLDLEKAHNETIRHLEKLAVDGPTEAELARVKAQFAREWLTDLSRFDSRADLISTYATVHHDPERINRRLQEIRQISADQVAQATVTHLQPSQLAHLEYRTEASHEAS